MVAPVRSLREIIAPPLADRKTLDAMYGAVTAAPEPPILSVADMAPRASFGGAGVGSSIFDGDKFLTGFGQTQLHQIDYWTLRMRSAQLFNDNLYARGLLRRLVTNEINVGLSPEMTPDADILGLSDEALNDWSEKVEIRFDLWGRNANVCDWKRRDTFGALQQTGRLEALATGDVLVVLRHNRRTRLQAVQLVSGNKVQNPLSTKEKIPKGHKVLHGVEFDKDGRVAAYWVVQDKGGTIRQPAWGARSGRRIAWLVFGTDKRLDDVRGQPILALVLQSLKEIDRYRDSAQRKAVINSMLAMYIQKDEDKMGTLPGTGGAVRRDQGMVTDADGAARRFNIDQQIPGMVWQELQTGEKPVGFTGVTDIDFANFEEAIIQTIAWANEVPPEILRLSFSSNYSASQAAINEFRIYLNKVWVSWGEQFCAPIFTEWLLSESMLRNIDSPGLLEAWRDPRRYDVFGAWTAVDWYGTVKIATDPLKMVKASKMMIAEGISTHARETRGITGMKWSKNIKRLIKENEQLVEARTPLAKFEQEFGAPLEEGGEIGEDSTPPGEGQQVRTGLDELTIEDVLGEIE